MTAHLAQLASLAASLPPGAVLAHVVTDEWLSRADYFTRRRYWAKIGDEPWRSVERLNCTPMELAVTWSWPMHWKYFRVVTDLVVWEQDYGLRGRHEVMGVVG